MEYHYNLTENDYFDSERGYYVLTLAENCVVSSDIEIRDCEMSENCYLVKMNYNKKTNTYTAIYKPY